MTEAYIDGFAKMAEECGVDPQALMKYAGIAQAAIPRVVKSVTSLASAKTYDELARAFASPGRVLTNVEKVMQRRLGRAPTFEEFYETMSRYRNLPQRGRTDTTVPHAKIERSLRKEMNMQQPTRTSWGQGVLRSLMQ